MECKRLPTPAGSGRDEKEYVITKPGSTGGIQRFKAGNHGAGHTLGAMIGYVQEGTVSAWDSRVAQWTQRTGGRGEPGGVQGICFQLEGRR